MTPQAVLTELLERLGASDGESVYVNNDEICTWPTEAVIALKAAGMLVKAYPASGVVCSGCQKRCSKEVEVFPEEDCRPARAMFVCDEPEDMGVIHVDLRSLERWQLSGASLADAFCRMIGVMESVRQDDSGKNFLLGILKGNKRSASVTLPICNGVSLSVGGHAVPVAEIVRFDGNGFDVDKVHLFALVDEPLTAESPQERANRLRESIREEKARGNRRFMKTVAKREVISESRLKQILSRKPASPSAQSGLSVGQTSRASSKAKKTPK